ncbi:MAG: hypothetical protein QOJ55_1675, partial [Solirubrobacteraceae bacterium]|nr:hypothetical protein [Solirubrobacteraceae bacterium]
ARLSVRRERARIARERVTAHGGNFTADGSLPGRLVLRARLPIGATGD